MGHNRNLADYAHHFDGTHIDLGSGNIETQGVVTFEDVSNVDAVGIVTARAGVKVPDNQKIFVGTGDDLQIYHSSGDAYIANSDGNLNIVNSIDGWIRLQPKSGEEGVVVKYDGAVELYHDNSLKLSTASGGINIAGNLNLNSADNYEIRLGANNDLKLYHDGTDSWVDTSTGDLILRSTADDVILRGSDDVIIQTDGSDNAIICNNNGSVDLYYNTAKKFETTSDGVKVSGNLDLSAIDSTISDTAVDVFIYDTSKDSDGGAWRKRTQYTSWYNETLNTTTRGSRKEFPAVAVIVCTSTTVRIYDGDDPDLPMWMEFVTGGNWSHILVSTAGYIKAAEMLNGELVIARNLNTGWQLVKVSFITDTAYAYKNVAHGTGDGQWYGGIVDRNGDGGYKTISTASNIVSQYNNDVAMTVLPNAPVDSATGLPVPTIAVATDAGVSVIKDNGTIVDIKRTSDDDVHYVDFNGDRVIMFMELGAIYVATIPNSDQSGNPNSNWSVYGSYGGNTSGTDHPAVQAYGAGVDLVSMKDHTFATAGYNDTNDLYKGLSILSENLESSGNGMVAWIRSDCNTGYMHGDIKGAFLSDTDTTNAVAAYYDDFANNDNGWGFVNTSISGGNMVITQQGSARSTDGDALSHVSTGVKLVFTGTVSGSGTGTFIIDDDGAGAGQGSTTTYGSVSSTGSFNFTATKTGSPRIRIMRTTGSNDYNINYLNISTEYDRSVNSKGLGVFGTINKSAVATGADLVGYSASSNTSYLEQPYNSALDYGTGDMYYSVWVYASSSDSFSGNTYIFERSSISDNSQRRIEARMTTPTRVEVYSCDTTLDNNVPVSSDVWFKLDIVRRSGEAFVYINGEYHSSTTGAAATRSLTDSNAKLVIGNRAYFATRQYGFPSNSKIALFRTGASAPSPEQIKKMYEDERLLFQENAKCTLYGSSDAVTALGYDEDTELLHVGTSAGRSDFQGLRRINNTTTAVTTAISAHDGFIVEQ